jgi:hypothetical protein
VSHIAWPEIESFHNVRKSVQKYPELLGGSTTVEYRAKVKLHGTNAAVQVRGDKVLAQSRTQIITPGCDNAGFAAWVESQEQRWVEQRWVETARDGTPETSMIYFGEWCGPGIMKGTAVNKIPGKIFAVFAVSDLKDAESSWIIDPEILRMLVDEIPGVHIIPWYGDAIEIPMLETPEVVQLILDRINNAVAAVEACDPWVRDAFGVDGIGEGLVFYPRGYGRKGFSDLCFKAKGEKHKIVAKSAAAQVDPSIAASVDAFVEMVLTDARLEQGARAAASGELTYEKRLIGPFLAWICKDVEKETLAEREASGLTWKQVQKAVSDRARGWYITNTEKLS